jgi:phosphoribosylformylglycinamidine (FGAM) synthase-like amidotransferase family enzyme
MSMYRALILNSPGSRGEKAFSHALKQVGFDAEILSIDEAVRLRLEQDQLSLKYKLVILPGGNTYGSVVGSGRVLALKIQHALGWNLNRFAERGGLVMGVGSGFETLLQLKIFGEDYALRLNDEAKTLEKWVRVIPTGTRCVWLRGLGTMDLPLNEQNTEFVIDSSAYVEAKGKLDRLGMGCLRGDPTLEPKGDRIWGLCDMTGRIFGLLPHPEYFLSWTNTEDWYVNPTRAAAPGSGMGMFENAARFAEG